MDSLADIQDVIGGLLIGLPTGYRIRLEHRLHGHGRGRQVIIGLFHAERILPEHGRIRSRTLILRYGDLEPVLVELLRPTGYLLPVGYVPSLGKLGPVHLSAPLHIIRRDIRFPVADIRHVEPHGVSVSAEHAFRRRECLGDLIAVAIRDRGPQIRHGRRTV